MKEIIEKIFGINKFVWPPFLPIIAIILSSTFSLQIPFIVCAIISIIFYGYFAFEIRDRKNIKDSLPSFCRTNEYWFNGLGAFIGWFSLYLLIFYVININSDSLSIALSSWVQHFGFSDLVLITLAYMGLTGYLPGFSLTMKT